MYHLSHTENKLLSDWITHVVSLVLLILLNCSNSVLVRGVYIDAEEPAGQCVIFPVYYIRLFFQKERTKKQKRLTERHDKVDQHNAVLLIDKPQQNHVSCESVVKTKIISVPEDVNLNEFNSNSGNVNHNNNHNMDTRNDEHTVLCENE